MSGLAFGCDPFTSANIGFPNGTNNRHFTKPFK